jgi:hypothetical protein
MRVGGKLKPDLPIQAIANTAGFHFGFIEQGGACLYPSPAQRVTSVEVLRILMSIGGTEVAHFQTWNDAGGDAPPLADPTNGLVFPDLNSPRFGGEEFQTNLIMPDARPFLSTTLPTCFIIRLQIPTARHGSDGLSIGQSRRMRTGPSAAATEQKTIAGDGKAGSQQAEGT